MRPGRLLLRVPAALRPAAGRVLLAGLLVTLLAPAQVAGARLGVPAGGDRRYEPPTTPLPAPPGTTSLVSLNRFGDFANQGSIQPAISENGRFVAFTSLAADLVGGDTNAATEVFLRDRRNGTTIRLPVLGGMVPTGGIAQDPAIAADGSVVAFSYTPPPGFAALVETPPSPVILGYDRKTGVTFLVSRTNKGAAAIRDAREPSVSADGRYIAYTTAVDVFSEDESGSDVFVFDRKTNHTVQVSVGPKGERTTGNSRAPSISGDGRLVAFTSGDGETLVHENTGKGDQVFVHDLVTGLNTWVSRAADGGPAFGPAGEPAISRDGAFVAFSSSAPNLVPEGTTGGQVFRRDLAQGSTVLVSITPAGVAGTGTSGQPSITANGGMVAFTSNAADLAVAARGGGIVLAAAATLPQDVLLRDIDAGETVIISVTTAGQSAMAAGFSRSLLPAVAAAGRFVAFASDSSLLVDDDVNKSFDVFVRDMPPVPVLTPALLDLGARAVGTESLPAAAVLGNQGWSPLAVTGATITGPNAADFAVVSDACLARSLKRFEACTVTVVFKPTGKGTRTATLEIADAYTGSPRTVRLRGAASLAKVELDPDIAQPGTVVIATGSGFPAGSLVRLRWSKGITPHLPDITADAKGAFRVQVLVFHNDIIGPRELVAEPGDGSGFPPVAASMLVVHPTAIPPRFGWLRFIDIPLVLVIRG